MGFSDIFCVGGQSKVNMTLLSKLTEITASIFSKDSRKLSRKLLLVAYLENFSESKMEAVIFVPSLTSRFSSLLWLDHKKCLRRDYDSYRLQN
jgi:hypothetical protein